VKTENLPLPPQGRGVSVVPFSVQRGSSSARPSPPREERGTALAWSVVVVALLLLSCTEKKSDPIPRAQPRPLEPLERVVAEPDAGAFDPMTDVVPFTPVGPPIPAGAVTLKLAGDVMPALPETGVVLLDPDEDAYLVQVATLLATFDDTKREVWLKHPDAPIAFQLTLRDAPSFQNWLDEPVPGKLRVIHRADGFELQTNLGKLPGGDPNGPTVPVRGGKMDLTTLQRGFVRIQAKFKSAPDVCFVPSFGMQLQHVARAMAVNYAKADSAFFEGICLVYPRTVARDAGSAK